MKKLIIVILTAFVSFAGYSQKTQYIGLPNNTVEVRNQLRIDALKDATGDSVMVVDAIGNVLLKAITGFDGVSSAYHTTSKLDSNSFSLNRPNGTKTVFLFIGDTTGSGTYNGTGSGSESRFGIEDNTGVQDRSMEMGSHSFTLRSGTSDYSGATGEMYIYPSFTRLYNYTDGTNYSSLNLTGSFGRVFSTSDNNVFADLQLSGSNSATMSVHDGIGGGTSIILGFSTAELTLNGQVARYIPLSVNGNYADATGNITIATGGSNSVDSTTASNGLTLVGEDVQWGGTVTKQILLYSDNYGLNFGNNYWANSGQSFSFGDFTQAANGGFAANRNSHAMGTYSTALNGANAYGDYSLATGGSRTASLGVYGVALGIQTYVNSYASFATGYNDTTNASYSSVLGVGLNAKYSHGTVIGKWNNRTDPVYGDYPGTQLHNPVDKVFQIGIGDSSLNPKNALDVYWSGRMRFTQYGSGTFVPGIYSMTAPTHSLQVDAQGNIIEGNLISAIGVATLSSGTVTVSSTLVKSTSKIFITANTPSGTQGFISVPVASIIDGTSFVINSSSAADNSTLNWIIIN